MSTNYVARIIVAAPVAGSKNTTVATWLNANLSEGANTVPADLGPGLALSTDNGIPPTVVYRWCGIALTLADAKLVLAKLCQLAGVATPTAAQWDNATFAQKQTWWNSVRGTIFTNYGVWCQLASNVGAWDDPQAVLTLRGWKTISLPL